MEITEDRQKQSIIIAGVLDMCLFSVLIQVQFFMSHIVYNIIIVIVQS